MLVLAHIAGLPLEELLPFASSGAEAAVWYWPLLPLYRACIAGASGARQVL